MSLVSRILLFFKAKTSAALDRAEDPRQMLDYSYAQQQELLRKVKQGLIEVATSKAQLQQQVKKLRARIPQMEDQARRAIGAGRQDLARLALERRQAALSELVGLESQTAEVEAEERKLTLAELQLSTRIDEFRTQRQVLSARYTAAQGQVRVSEALTGVSGELADLSMALGRAEEKTEQLQARASAIDALIESGSLALPGGGGDPVERELRKFAAARAVDEQLAALTAQLNSGGAPPPALGSGPALDDKTQ